jgi:hypothetical protein
MKERRVRTIKIRIGQRRQSPEELLRAMRGLARKPPVRITSPKRKG